jgi:hypothetical protein
VKNPLLKRERPTRTVSYSLKRPYVDKCRQIAY